MEMNKTTSRLIRSSAVAMAAVAALFVMSQDASAQSCGYGGGYGGIGISAGYGNGISVGINRISFNQGNYGYSRNIGYSTYRPTFRQSSYHNTGHYDYHPGSYVRHGNHYDYQRGHYDYHNTGHWHR
ncbi:MAG: hypothetical protein ACI87E_004208 [Mariniblastus sp.]|jgi:hypothetical protein